MITVFLPCRAGSQRIPHKNTKDFSGIKGGLLKIKLEQLLKVPSIKKVVVSTNDKEVIEIASNTSYDKIEIDVRPEHLASSATTTDELIDYVPSVIHDKHILWTHVTSPFLDAKMYESLIEEYFKRIKENDYDSLMTVNKLQTFIWNEVGALNYKRHVEKWPRTQTLPKLYEVNSGAFINSRNNYIELNDRIGKSPFLYETNGRASFDIDWPEDFQLAELMYKFINR